MSGAVERGAGGSRVSSAAREAWAAGLGPLGPGGCGIPCGCGSFAFGAAGVGVCVLLGGVGGPGEELIPHSLRPHNSETTFVSFWSPSKESPRLPSFMFRPTSPPFRAPLPGWPSHHFGSIPSPLAAVPPSRPTRASPCMNLLTLSVLPRRRAKSEVAGWSDGRDDSESSRSGGAGSCWGPIRSLDSANTSPSGVRGLWRRTELRAGVTSRLAQLNRRAPYLVAPFLLHPDSTCEEIINTGDGKYTF